MPAARAVWRACSLIARGRQQLLNPVDDTQTLQLILAVGRQATSPGRSPLRSISSWSTVFRQRDERNSGTNTAGLFGRPELRQPRDWLRVANDTQARVSDLLSQLLATPAEGADVRVVGLMDDMSDEICRAYDAAECCRNVHTDPEWRRAAGQACEQMAALISELNQHEPMYRLLCAALANREEAAAALERRETPRLSPFQLAEWCPESVLVGRRLRHDMEQSGIHLPPAARSRLGSLAAAGHHYAAAFNAALTDPKAVGSCPAPPGGRAWGRGWGGALPLDPGSVAAVMAGEARGEVRRQVYLAAGATPAANGPLLARMVRERAELARLQGYPSYAAMRLGGGASLAGGPGPAAAFLGRLAEEARPLAERELQELSRLKASDPSAAPGPVAPWDLEYYAARARAARTVSPPSALLAYTARHRVLAGCGRLLNVLFGVDVTLGPAGPGEGWAPGVLRLDVWGGVGSKHEAGALMGTIYLDLEDRPGKYPSAVTFPLTCGRQLPDGSHRPPAMALLAPCSGRGPGGGPAFTWRELRTLLHELGHAAHNILSRTRYQHLWGTRCAQDLVEVPSHLFELFAAHPASLALLASTPGPGPGGEGGEPLPEGLLREQLSARSATAALELQSQLALALADQAYHGSGDWGAEGEPGDGRIAEVWQQATAAASCLPPPPGCRPELRAGHLALYGASYYTYPFARCLAAGLWADTLGLGGPGGPLDAGAGELLRSRLLGPGGAVEPRELVAGLEAAAAARERRREAGGGAAGNGRERSGQQQQQQQQQQQRGGGGGAPSRLLEAVEGGWAPRPDRYLESLKAF